MKPLAIASVSVLQTEAVIAGGILSALLFLLQNIIKYSPFSSLSVKQKIINCSALAILFVVCWLGVDILFLQLIFPYEEWSRLSPMLNIRIVIAFMIYLLAIFVYGNIYKNDEQIEDVEDAINDATFAATNNEDAISDESGQKEILERIAIKNGQKIEVIPVSDIIYLQAEGDYVMIHSGKGKFLKEQTMKSFESLLPTDKFVRVHRSSIVNVDFIAQIELYNKQSQLLKLKNGAQVRISLNGYKLLKQTLGL